MRIKELDDVLALADQMPREWQMKCVRALAVYVNSWEQRQQEPDLSEREWQDLQTRRHLDTIGKIVEKAVRALRE